VNWTSRSSAAGDVQLTHRWRESNLLELTARLRNADGTGRNGLTLTAVVNGPEETRQTLELEQFAPGQYSATLSAEEIGTYLVTLYAEGNLDPRIFAVNKSYPAEYDLGAPNPAKLQRIARAGGGISPRFEPSGFPHAELPRERLLASSEISVSPELLIAGMVLFALIVLGEAIYSRRRSSTRTTVGGKR
jgi:hypothetical protein